MRKEGRITRTLLTWDEIRKYSLALPGISRQFYLQLVGTSKSRYVVQHAEADLQGTTNTYYRTIGNHNVSPELLVHQLITPRIQSGLIFIHTIH
jgi:hypothetical protein